MTIDAIKAELEELQSAYDELRLLADGRLAIKPEYVRGLEKKLTTATEALREITKAQHLQSISHEKYVVMAKIAADALKKVEEL